MASTRDYTDFLNDQVDISPANSQEELQAAELIEGLFAQHGLETQIQEFDTPLTSGLSTRVYFVFLFVGVLLSGFLGTPVAVVGLLLVIAAFALILLARNGNDVLGSLGPQARSQNVIGVHRATGPNVIKGNRPIVIVAHYDTPHESFLNNRQFAKWQPIIKRLSWSLCVTVLVVTLLQPVPFIPVLARHVLWVLGVLAALPLLLLGAAAIYERFAPCSTGASDNKSSVAAMLGVLDMVRPGPDDAKQWAESNPLGVRRELADDLAEEDDLYADDDWADEVQADEEAYEEEYEGEGDASAEDALQQDDARAEDEAWAPEAPYGDEDAPDQAGDAAVATRALKDIRSDDEPQGHPRDLPEADDYGIEEPSTIRRGAALLESLQVLPETCEIVYEGLAPREEVIGRMEGADSQGAAAEGLSRGVERIREAGRHLGEVIGRLLEMIGAGASALLARIRELLAGLASRVGSLRGGGSSDVEGEDAADDDVPLFDASAWADEMKAADEAADEPVSYAGPHAGDEAAGVEGPEATDGVTAEASGVGEDETPGPQSAENDEHGHAEVMGEPVAVVEEAAEPQVIETPQASEAEAPCEDASPKDVLADAVAEMGVPNGTPPSFGLTAEILPSAQAEAVHETAAEEPEEPERPDTSAREDGEVAFADEGTDVISHDEGEEGVSDLEVVAPPDEEDMTALVDDKVPLTQAVHEEDAVEEQPSVVEEEAVSDEPQEDEWHVPSIEVADAFYELIDDATERGGTAVGVPVEVVDVPSLDVESDLPAPRDVAVIPATVMTSEPADDAETVEAVLEQEPPVADSLTEVADEDEHGEELEPSPTKMAGHPLAEAPESARLWTPPIDLAGDIEEPEDDPDAAYEGADDEVDGEADATLKFKVLSHEEVAASRVEIERSAHSADDVAVVAAQRPDAAVEDGDARVEAAAQATLSDVLHEMFVTLPKIEPMVAEPALPTVSGQDVPGAGQPGRDTSEPVDGPRDPKTRPIETGTGDEADPASHEKPEEEPKVERKPSPRPEAVTPEDEGEALGDGVPGEEGVGETAPAPEGRAQEPAADPEPEPEPEPESEAVGEAVLEMEPVPGPEQEPDLEPGFDSDHADQRGDTAVVTSLAEGITFSNEQDASEEELSDKDLTGLTVSSRENQADVEDSMPVVREHIPKPRAIDDPDWGKSEFKPPVMSAGRRTMLLDLPDPSVIDVDPLAPSHDDDMAKPTPTLGGEVSHRLEVLRRVPSPAGDAPEQQPSAAPSREASPAEEPRQPPQEEAAATPMHKYNQGTSLRAPKKGTKRKMRFGRKRRDEETQVESMGEWLGLDEDYDAKRDGRQIGSWDNFDDDDRRGPWKGGATLRAGLRDDRDRAEEPSDPVPGVPNFDSLDLRGEPSYEDDQPVAEEQGPDPEGAEELREEALHLGDDDLISHDIWFVGVGASSLDHAGMKAFLDEHRRDIRGAFLVNLDSIGAGDLTLLTREGTGNKRRADRRMGRMLTNIADALHIDLRRADHSWDETDATPAMQRSVRVATLMGMSEDGVAALSHTSDDEPEYLNDQQIADVADIIAELIRRS